MGFRASITWTAEIYSIELCFRKFYNSISRSLEVYIYVEYRNIYIYSYCYDYKSLKSMQGPSEACLPPGARASLWKRPWK